MITLQSGGVLSFGLASYSTSVFELMAEEVLMSDSVLRVYGALKLTVKMLLMWNSLIKIDGNPDDFMLATSTVETSNLVILRVRIHYWNHVDTKGFFYFPKCCFLARFLSGN